MAAWDIVKIIMQILGGMGTFLVGMKLLSENMSKLAHGKLKSMLNRTAKNRFAGVGIGTAVTVTVQSSAFTTVMVVGLVNAGIMTLFQATSVIMGANIGTTITAWIASMNGLDVLAFAPVLAAVGVFMMMFSKNERVQMIGTILAGLGILFVGLSLMSSAMNFKTLENGEKIENAVKNALSAIDNPALLLLIGVVLTALMQSSSALTGIIVAMATAGLSIGGGGDAVYYIIIGTNIGSCVTALISSLGASPNARRAAVIHLLFNLFGAIIFIVVLLIWGAVGGSFSAMVLERVFPHNPAFQIALFHTIFNVVNTLLFLPFVKGFVWLAEHIVREEKKGKEAEKTLISEPDERLLRQPSVALGYLYQETGKMFAYAMDTLDISFTAFMAKDTGAAEKVQEHNRALAEANKMGSANLVRLSASPLVIEEERTVSALHYVLSDIMRIGELADNLTKYTRRYAEDGLEFSDEFLGLIRAMFENVRKLYALSLAAFLSRDRGALGEVDRLEDEIDNERKDLLDRHIKRLNEGKCQPQNSSVFISLVGNLERAADHINYIAHSIE